MKRFLTLLSAIGLAASSSSVIVSCSNKTVNKETNINDLIKTRNDLLKQKEESEKKISDIFIVIKDYEKQINSFDYLFEEVEQRYQFIKDNISIQEKITQDRINAMDEIYKRYQNNVNELNNKKDEFRLVDTEINRLINEKKLSELELEKLNEEINEKLVTSNYLKQEMDKSNEEYEQAIKDKEAFDAAVNSIGNLEDEIEKLRNEVSVIDEEIKAILEQIDSESKELKDLENKDQTEETEIDILGYKRIIKRYKNKIGKLESHKNDLKSEIDLLNEKLNVLRNPSSEYLRLNNAIEEKKNNQDINKRKLNSWEILMKPIKDNRNKTEKYIEIISDQITAKEIDAKSLSNNVLEIKNKIDADWKEYKALDSRLKSNAFKSKALNKLLNSPGYEWEAYRLKNNNDRVNEQLKIFNDRLFKERELLKSINIQLLNNEQLINNQSKKAINQ